MGASIKTGKEDSGIRENFRLNEQIRSREVRLIGPEGEQLGVFSIKEALERASDMGYDLCEIAPNARPPVCRVMDFGKYKYEMAKKQREVKKKQKVVKVKEVKLRPKIKDHDYETKLSRVRRFIGDGAKVKVTMMFRGREMAHVDYGRRILDRLIEDTKEIATVVKPPKQEGRNLSLMLQPS